MFSIPTLESLLTQHAFNEACFVAPLSFWFEAIRNRFISKESRMALLKISLIILHTFYCQNLTLKNQEFILFGYQETIQQMIATLLIFIVELENNDTLNFSRLTTITEEHTNGLIRKLANYKHDYETTLTTCSEMVLVQFIKEIYDIQLNVRGRDQQGGVTLDPSMNQNIIPKNVADVANYFLKQAGWDVTTACTHRDIIDYVSKLSKTHDLINVQDVHSGDLISTRFHSMKTNLSEQEYQINNEDDDCIAGFPQVVEKIRIGKVLLRDQILEFIKKTENISLDNLIWQFDKKDNKKEEILYILQNLADKKEIYYENGTLSINEQRIESKDRIVKLKTQKQIELHEKSWFRSKKAYITSEPAYEKYLNHEENSDEDLDDHSQPKTKPMIWRKIESLTDKARFSSQEMQLLPAMLNDSKWKDISLKKEFIYADLPLHGFKNINENCYLNSLLQVLLNIKQFTDEIRDMNSNDQFIRGIKSLLESMDSSRPRVYQTHHLIRFLFPEHDANVQKDIIEVYDIIMGRFGNASQNFIKENFTIKLIKHQSAPENVKYTIYDNVLRLTTTGNSVNELIVKMQETQNGEAGYAYSIEYDTLPHILVVQLPRFNLYYHNDGSAEIIKDKRNIEFQKELQLEIIDETSRIYKLYSVIVHAGNIPQVGHYYCYLCFGDNWFKCNDSDVTQVEIDEVLSKRSGIECAYVLVYLDAEKIDTLLTKKKRYTKRSG